MAYCGSRECRLMPMISLQVTFFFVEIIVGYVTNSMALVADSFHMLTDVACLIVTFVSVKISPKKWSKSTYGWARAEVLGALVNSVFLVAVCFSITVEACKRFIEPEEIQEAELLVGVGTLGLIVNLVGLCLLHNHDHDHSHHGKLSSSDDDEHRQQLRALMQNTAINNDDEKDDRYEPPVRNRIHHHHHHHHNHHDSSQMTMHAAFLHVLSDALGSVIVIISALIIWLTEWEYKYHIDPALSLILVMIILHPVSRILRESISILLQNVPAHIQVDAIQQKLLANVDGVLAVHEFHVWQLAGDRIIASAHICCRKLSEYMKIAEQVKESLHTEGIHFTTIQPHFLDADN